jgi:hypothetical protein
MQTILQNQIGRFAGNIFQEGSTVRGLEMNYESNYDYVKLRDKNSTGANTIVVTNFLNKIVKGSTSGVRALVVATSPGAESNTPYFKTFHVRYLSSNNTVGAYGVPSGSGFTRFANNEILTVVDNPNLTANTIKPVLF